ncbi:hypothetical protein [Streptomyces europaeiscabiei]|uniref:hypothetical protein n=1 Tax=Streptomyces europaeiscabiei TaxID=146819 RepID=UPI002E26D4B6|nr:hypothetical protein OG858_21740 [Streptomyces europaeiscabiei]
MTAVQPEIPDIDWTDVCGEAQPHDPVDVEPDGHLLVRLVRFRTITDVPLTGRYL